MAATNGRSSLVPEAVARGQRVYAYALARGMSEAFADRAATRAYQRWHAQNIARQTGERVADVLAEIIGSDEEES